MFVNDTSVLVLSLPILLTVVARENSALEDSDAGQLRNFSSRHGDHDRHLEQYARCFIARELGQPPLDVFSFFSLMAGCRS